MCLVLCREFFVDVRYGPNANVWKSTDGREREREREKARGARESQSDTLYHYLPFWRCIVYVQSFTMAPERTCELLFLAVIPRSEKKTVYCRSRFWRCACVCVCECSRELEREWNMRANEKFIKI